MCKKISTVLRKISTMIEPSVFNVLERLAKKDKVSISQKTRYLLLKALETFEDNSWESIVSTRKKNQSRSIPHKKFWKKEESIRRGLADAKSGRLFDAPENYLKYVKEQDSKSTNRVKFTATITKDLLRKINHEKKKQGLTRNALIQKIIKLYFQDKSGDKQKLVALIAEYKKKPEKVCEISARTLAQIRNLGKF